MTASLRLAWRYLAYHRVRTTLLVVCVALVFLLPIAVQLLVDSYSRALGARAAATPLVAGAPGSRYDLVLNALYFEGRVPAPTTMAEVEALRARGDATPIPLLARQRAKGYPLVGTTLDYFAFRGLRPAAGTLPLILGDAVVGATVAADLGLAPGDKLLTDPPNLYDLSLGYPLRMKVVGVLAETGTADDGAVFVDVKTAWIVEGIGHGHKSVAEEKPGAVLERKEGEVVYNASLVEANEITPENIESFHFHGIEDEFPLTAILVLPRDAKASTQLKGRYRVSKTAQLLVPTEVVAEILGFVFRLKTFFDANAILVTVATILFLALIVALQLRVRRRELETLFKIGCARWTTFKLVATELLLTVGAGLALALAGAVTLAMVMQ